MSVGGGSVGGNPEPGWYPDPSGNHELRWYDGNAWTAHVSDRGEQSHDDPGLPAIAGYSGQPAAYGVGSPAAHQTGTHTPPGGVTFSDAAKRVLSKYVDFSGRAPRSEYWWWTLAVALASLVLGALFSGATQETFDAVFGLFFLAVALPSLAVTVRRLHDTDRSGWMVLVSFIPFVGGIILLVFMAQEGSRRANQWGPPL